MGKRLIPQRRGKGSHPFLATHRAVAKAEYLSWEKAQDLTLARAQVVDLVLDPGRTALLAKLLYEDKSLGHVVAAEGLKLNQEVLMGKDAGVAVGNILPLADIPEGCPVFSVEKIPGDGGSLIRSSGIYGLIVSKDKNRAFIKMPSGKSIAVDLRGRATIGCVSCGGRAEKPFIKAGRKHFAMRARKRQWPKVRGVAMNALDHPFGGSQHHPGKSKSTSKHAPAGRKVGAIGSKRTGRKKK